MKMGSRLLLCALLLAALGCSHDAADPREQICSLERAKAGLLADIHSEREECRALGISLAAEPQAERNRMVARCFESAVAASEPTLQMVRDMDRRIEDLRRLAR